MQRIILGLALLNLCWSGAGRIPAFPGRPMEGQRPDGSDHVLGGGRRERAVQDERDLGARVPAGTAIEHERIATHQVSRVDGVGTIPGVLAGIEHANVANPLLAVRSQVGSSKRSAAPARSRRGAPAPVGGGIVDELRRYSGHNGAVTDVAVARDGRHAVSASLDQTIRFWDLERPQAVRTLAGHKGPVFCVDISPDAKLAVSGGVDRTVRIWDLATGKELRRMVGHEAGVLDVAFSPDGRRILSAGGGFYSSETRWTSEKDFSVRLWDATTGKEIHRLAGHTAMLWNVAFSRDGARAVSAGDDGTVRLWDLSTGRELACDKRHSGPVFSAGFVAPGKNTVVSAGGDGLVWIRTLPGTGTERSVRFGKGNSNHFGAITTDGRRAAIGQPSWWPHNQGYLYIWDLNKGQAGPVLRWGSGGLTRGTFLPDGYRLLWGSADGTLHLLRIPH